MPSLIRVVRRGEVAANDPRRNALSAKQDGHCRGVVLAVPLPTFEENVIDDILVVRGGVDILVVGDRGADILLDGNRRVEGVGLPGGELARQLTSAVRDRIR